MFVLIYVALSDVSYCIAIIRQCLENTFLIYHEIRNKKTGKQLSAVFKTSLANSPDFSFISISISTLPTNFFAELLAANTFLLKPVMLAGFPSRSIVSIFMLLLCLIVLLSISRSSTTPH